MSEQDNVFSLDKKRSSDENRIEFDELTNAEVLELFFAELDHPSTPRTPGALARHLHRGLIDTDESDATRLSWRARVQAAMVDTFLLDKEVVDEWIETDRPFRILMTSLQELTKQKEPASKELRDVLLALVDLRAGVIKREENENYEEERWIKLEARLLKPTDSHQ